MQKGRLAPILLELIALDQRFQFNEFKTVRSTYRINSKRGYFPNFKIFLSCRRSLVKYLENYSLTHITQYVDTQYTYTQNGRRFIFQFDKCACAIKGGSNRLRQSNSIALPYHVRQKFDLVFHTRIITNRVSSFPSYARVLVFLTVTRLVF